MQHRLDSKPRRPPAEPGGTLKDDPIWFAQDAFRRSSEAASAIRKEHASVARGIRSITTDHLLLLHHNEFDEETQLEYKKEKNNLGSHLHFSATPILLSVKTYNLNRLANPLLQARNLLLLKDLL